MSHLVMSMLEARANKGTILNTIISNICQNKTQHFFKRNKTFLHAVKLNKSTLCVSLTHLKGFKSRNYS